MPLQPSTDQQPANNHRHRTSKVTVMGCTVWAATLESFEQTIWFDQGTPRTPEARELDSEMAVMRGDVAVGLLRQMLLGDPPRANERICAASGKANGTSATQMKRQTALMS
ncbi:hypothetical protein AC579_921 [Pseudocercospora musae]|uniref:Uncharacterized protein n=1 Tax=Pseudocercospora musae TaxID=113226 RepID=A0A139HCE6_9PEZI|nr:hypothetical protein AC579_921 [Pseudocercospora musae]